MTASTSSPCVLTLACDSNRRRENIRARFYIYLCRCIYLHRCICVKEMWCNVDYYKRREVPHPLTSRSFDCFVFFPLSCSPTRTSGPLSTRDVTSASSCHFFPPKTTRWYHRAGYSSYFFVYFIDQTSKYKSLTVAVSIVYPL